MDKVAASEDLRDRLCLSEVVKANDTRVLTELDKLLLKHSHRSVLLEKLL